jgi:hypothetical protein
MLTKRPPKPLNTGYKIYSKITAERLTVIAEPLLLEEQKGFRKDRSCMDCIFVDCIFMDCIFMVCIFMDCIFMDCIFVDCIFSVWQLNEKQRI